MNRAPEADAGVGQQPARGHVGAPPPAAAGDPAAELRRETAGLLACVHCGFCLNACPTYTRMGHEGDSPRGRLDLMRAVVEGRLSPDDEAYQLHIDRCLGCRACEPVCPSGVPYGFLLERARAAIAQSTGVSPSTRLLIAGYTGPLRSLVTMAARLLRRTGVAEFLAPRFPHRLPALRFALAMLASSAPWPGLGSAGRARPSDGAAAAARGQTRPEPEPGARTAAPAAAAPPAAAHLTPGTPPADAPGGAAEDVTPGRERTYADPHALAGAYPRATAAPVRQRIAPAAGPRVALLTGCVQESLFARVNEATERVLAVNGSRVVRVPAQVCCGALDAHAGRLERARELARRNIAAFENAGVEYIVVNAAGCGAMMKEYGEQLKDDADWSARAEAFVKRVRDVSEFLVERPLAVGAPVALRVTFDAPCHLHHGQRIREAPLRVLDSIPGLERVPLPDAEECCGGAGLYGIHHPELGGRVLADKVAAIRSTGADAVLTPNPGCMMQIGAGLLLAGERAAVLHPLELLDESYRRDAETRRE